MMTQQERREQHTHARARTHTHTHARARTRAFTPHTRTDRRHSDEGTAHTRRAPYRARKRERGRERGREREGEGREREGQRDFPVCVCVGVCGHVRPFSTTMTCMGFRTVWRIAHRAKAWHTRVSWATSIAWRRLSANHWLLLRHMCFSTPS
jgi:hypothetical protein